MAPACRQVVFANEPGIDQTGLTVDMLAQFFKSLRSAPATAHLFERKDESAPRVLPMSDALCEAVRKECNSGGVGGSGSVGGAGSSGGDAQASSGTQQPPAKRQRRPAVRARDAETAEVPWLPATGDRVDCNVRHQHTLPPSDVPQPVPRMLTRHSPPTHPPCAVGIAVA